VSLFSSGRAADGACCTLGTTDEPAALRTSGCAAAGELTSTCSADPAVAYEGPPGGVQEPWSIRFVAVQWRIADRGGDGLILRSFGTTRTRSGSPDGRETACEMRSPARSLSLSEDDATTESAVLVPSASHRLETCRGRVARGCRPVGPPPRCAPALVPRLERDTAVRSDATPRLRWPLSISGMGWKASAQVSSASPVCSRYDNRQPAADLRRLTGEAPNVPRRGFRLRADRTTARLRKESTVCCRWGRVRPRERRFLPPRRRYGGPPRSRLARKR
jgi:hypothetical protein